MGNGTLSLTIGGIGYRPHPIIVLITKNDRLSQRSSDPERVVRVAEFTPLLRSLGLRSNARRNVSSVHQSRALTNAFPNEEYRVVTTTQPILCCLGESVAGRPTQFMMERAFASLHLDWRAITAEVDRRRLGVAVDGLAAMQFMALRFFPSLESAASEKLFTADAVEKFVGSATSAALVQGEWVAWDHRGHAILRTLGGPQSLASSWLWLHGNSPQNRSLLVALTHSPTWPAQIIWTDSGLDAQDIPSAIREPHGSERNSDTSSSSVGKSTASMVSEKNSGEQPVLRLMDWEAAREQLAASENDAAASPPVELVVIADELDAIRLNDVRDMIDSGHWNSMRAIGDSASVLDGCQFISSVDLAIAAETYDFYRWTGLECDPGLLRDAYDEYCDF